MFERPVLPDDLLPDNVVLLGGLKVVGLVGTNEDVVEVNKEEDIVLSDELFDETLDKDTTIDDDAVEVMLEDVNTNWFKVELDTERLEVDDAGE